MPQQRLTGENVWRLAHIFATGKCQQCENRNCSALSLDNSSNKKIEKIIIMMNTSNFYKYKF